MKRLIPPLLLLMVSSCVSLDKAIQVATKNETYAEATQQALNNKHALIVAENCATLYPIAESEETETVTEMGNVDEFKQRAIDAEARADSLEREAQKLPVKPECEPEVKARNKVIAALKSQITDLSRQAQEIRADKERVLTTITKKSTAELEAERLKRERAEGAQAKAEVNAESIRQLADKYKKQRNTLLWIVGGAVVAVVLAGLRKLKIV